MKKKLQSSLLLTLAALIWGTTFVAQSSGMNYIGGFTFNTFRYLIGGIVLLPYIVSYLIRDSEYQKAGADGCKARRKLEIKGGICCGIVLFAASGLQQFGIAFTTVGKAGFITALYIIIVPLLGLFLHKKVGINVWSSVVIAAVGMYLLCINENLAIGKGDLLVFFCAIGFSVHILVIDYFSPRGNSFVISCVQFFTAGALSGLCMLLFEDFSWSAVAGAAFSLLYAGVFSSGIAFTLQVVAQKNVEPTLASLLMSLESVFSLVAGWLILGQKMTPKELLGSALVFGAIILAQIPIEMFGRKRIR